MNKATLRQAKYDKNNTVKYTLKLNLHTDADIIKAIDRVVEELETSKQGAIKHLIRKSGV